MTTNHIPAAGTPDVAEPKQVYINDILVRLDQAFPGTEDAEMPGDAMDNVALPENHPIKG